MRKAFTLIELLVVIAIIALLLSIIVPSLRLAKMKASSVVCMTNTKNMSLAWYSYQADNNGRIMSAQMDAREENGTYVGWIGAPFRSTPGDLANTAVNTPPITEEDAIRGIQQGRLHEYLKSPQSYKCPGDTIRKSVYDQVTPYVSYSLSRALYWTTNRSSQFYNQQIRAFGEITSPSTRYVFVEVAQERNWNQSGWFSFGAPEYYGQATGHNRPGGWGWWDPLAINHGDSSIIGYTDGHAETRRWQDPFTRERVEKLSRTGVAMYNVEFPPDGQTADIEYMARGWAYRYR
ncbi:MAG TPA: prepilin-type N-terminal cleavage/methylation domain-containing protein [Phycisphaerales bacterium]|nr:prepilin-type N-terminal cleavage/methylation domain-containing protein [Phycisphaerales bacterium]